MEEGQGSSGRKEATGSFRISSGSLGASPVGNRRDARSPTSGTEAHRPAPPGSAGEGAPSAVRAGEREPLGGRKERVERRGRKQLGRLVWETASSTARGRGLRAASTALGGAALQPLAAF